MLSHENSVGKPLADGVWLEAHHRAKLPEREAFARRLAAMRPRRVVDLGCATGLWLELLNEVLPTDCVFVGIDGDDEALASAAARSAAWRREVSFLKLDLETDASQIPSADLTLAFNVFSYITDLGAFLDLLAERQPRGALAVRQYDGASIRFGPLATSERQRLEADLRVATDRSERFRHYDLDRAWDIMHESPYYNGVYEFELFARTSPFPTAFADYYHGTLEWTRNFLSPDGAAKLDAWMARQNNSRYFFEVDLVAILS